jgi:hypothetical protein
LSLRHAPIVARAAQRQLAEEALTSRGALSKSRAFILLSNS